MYDVTTIQSSLRRAFPADRIISDHSDDNHYYKDAITGKRTASVTTRLSFVSKPYLQTWYAKRAVEFIRENLPVLLGGEMSILDDALGAATRSRDSSAQIGTNAHEAYDRYLQEWIRTGRRPDKSSAQWLDPGASGDEICATRSFDRFLNETELIPVASEIRVWYEKGTDCFAGTVDALFILLTVRKGRQGQQGQQGCAHDYSYQEASKVFWCVRCGRECDAKLILGDHKTSNSIKGKDDYAQQGNAYAKAIEIATGIKIDEVWVMRYGKSKAEYEVARVTDRKQAWREFVAISRAFDTVASRGDGLLLAPLKEKITASLYDSH